jgi:uncharacterized protein (DUF1501 family)
MLRVGGLATLGLSMPELLQARQAAPAKKGRAKACIVLFLMGGPPQQSTWDPKPDAPADVRGNYQPIATNVPGIRISELLPKIAKHADKLCLLRAMSTSDNAHSSSGYYMMTGVPHQPMNFENANPGAPNDWPNLGGIVRKLRGDRKLPAAIRLPMRIFNTDGSVWPGQDAGFLGRNADPWLFHCEPAAPTFRIPEFTLAADVAAERLEHRADLLKRLDRTFASADRLGHYDRVTGQAFDLLRSPQARAAFDLGRETPAVRDRYGRSQFGQSTLLARRLVEAGVSLVQVNWFRGADEPADAPCWDSHAKETERLKNNLCPPLDQALSALLEDLTQRGQLEETLVACISEFGRTPKMSGNGRGHWGYVFSVALAGGGIKGGQVYGASDAHGGQPRDGRVPPQDLTATILDCLGYEPHTEIRDNQGRPLPVSRGQVLRSILT